jgi:hypothetical protein
MIASGLAFAAGTGAQGAEAVPLTVNQREVSRAEFRWFMEQERARVFAYFKEQHHVEDGKGFWTQKTGGTTPSAMLQSNTVARIVRERTEHNLFQELGLLQDVSFAAFVTELEKRNQEREQAARQGRTVYGPVRYSALQYYEHRKATLRAQAMEILGQKRWSPSEDELKSYYDRHLSQFRSSATYTVEVVTIEADPETSAGTNAASVRAAADEVQAKLNAGIAWPTLLKEPPREGSVKVSGQRFEQLNVDRLGELFPDAQQLKAVEALLPGQTTLLADSGVRVRVVRCFSRTPGADRPYDAVRRQVKDLWLGQRYQQHLEGLAAQAQVKLDQEVIDQLLP